ncbi:SusC/RagA family TonB-linked outer membrane protein [Aurantibacter sp.]|uniref:SusC/RagA family TonB-linked outer membrane protein n=1 Tax=Aurantibacter sp. TaxID=2807103 RepID=UPI0035C7F393
MKTKFSGILTLFLAFVVQLTFAQEKTISGVVSDENSLPLPTATVLVKGTANGTSTDFDGNYSITANTGDVLVFSYVGYADQEVAVGAENTISVTLQLDSQLEEVVVTAFGIKRKKDEVTTAYQEVGTEDLVKANNPNIVNSLSGKVSGLQITQTSNGVDGDNRIVLRGNRSISGSNEALIVIDGVAYGTSTTILNSLDPNVIENVNVIKGAAGSALYGSQGSNGAIIVTTKKGSGDGSKASVKFNSSLDLEVVDYVPERQTRYGQGWDLGNGFENIVYENGGWGPEYDGQMVPVGLPQADGTFIMAPYSSRGSDHIKEFFSTGITKQNSVSISAGDSDGYINFSARNVDTEFVIKNDTRKRNTFTVGAGKTLGKWTLGSNVIYTNTTADRHNGDLYTQLLQTPGNVPITAFENSGNEGHWNAYFTNPYWNRDNQRAVSQSNNVAMNFDLGFKFNDHISAKIVTSARINEGNGLSYQNGYDEPDEIVNNTGANRTLVSNFQFNNSRSSQYYTDLFLNFDYMLTDDISFNALVGANNQYNKSSFTSVGGEDLTIPGIFNSSNLNNGFSDALTDDDRRSNSRIGVFANIDLGYKDFLYLTVTGRNDWSSTLDPSNNSFFYPSVSSSFIATKAFPSLKSNTLNALKFTAAYVKVGNDGGIGAYQITPLVNQAPRFPLGGQNSFIADQTITDPLLTPEFTTSFEFGMNLGMFKDRVTLDGSFQSFNTTDQITSVGASAASGLSRATINVGETKGIAYEIDLGIKVIKTDKINLDVNLGYYTSENEVVKVSDQATEVTLGGFTGFAEVFAIEGENFPVIQTNYYERDDLGRVIVSPTGLPVEAAGLKVAGRTTPKHILNLNTKFRYKNWTLQATMDYRTGHVFYSDTKSNLTWSGHAVETAQGGRGAFILPNSAIEDPTNPGTYIANTSTPSGGTTAGSYINWFNNYRNVGENHILDATAFKVRELSLRYDFSDELLKNSFIKGLSLSATARNPFTILPAENRGYNDPEAGFTSGNAAGITTQAGNYPATKTFGLGLNLTF